MNKLLQAISAFIAGCPHGWCTEEKAHAFACAIYSLRPEVCVEIGVWSGKSLIPVAMSLKEVGRGIVYAIDPWSAPASAEGQQHANEAWWSTQDHEAIYQDFYKRLALSGAMDCVRVQRAKSDEVDVPRVIDFLHIDGNHGDQAIKDAERFGARVRVGGLCFMDDLNWEGGAVLRAVAKLKSSGFVSLYRLDTGEMFQRIK